MDCRCQDHACLYKFACGSDVEIDCLYNFSIWISEYFVAVFHPNCYKLMFIFLVPTDEVEVTHLRGLTKDDVLTFYNVSHFTFAL